MTLIPTVDRLPEPFVPTDPETTAIPPSKCWLGYTTIAASIPETSKREPASRTASSNSNVCSTDRSSESVAPTPTIPSAFSTQSAWELRARSQR